mmetsp:Transcript_12548/g.32163  ORF Transcript_12548/g.32163 Transcript_12548/m.32163 type:complete len:264 (-) Transcript_12548:140-931(-)|eukprot:jgi/Tetstr1/440406/TSEL_028740.t1
MEDRGDAGEAGVRSRSRRLLATLLRDRGSLLNLARSVALHSALYASAAAYFSTARSTPLKHKPHAAARRVMATIHAAVSTSLCARAFLKGPKRTAREAHWASTARQRQIIEFSTGYFVVDTVYLLTMERSPLFLAHHAYALLHFLSVLATNRGGTPVEFALAAGEISGPFLSLEWLFREAGAKKLEAVTGAVFRALFLSMRCAFVPLYLPSLTSAYLKKDVPKDANRAVARLQGVLVLGAALGGLEWSRRIILKARSGGQFRN